MFLLFAILPTELNNKKKKAGPQTFAYLNRHSSRSARMMHMTLHTQNMEPLRRKRQNWEGGNKKFITFV